MPDQQPPLQEQFPGLAERMREAARLQRECAGREEDPATRRRFDEGLAAIGYTAVTGADGLQTVLPRERLDQWRETQERQASRSRIFDEVSFWVRTVSGYDTTMSTVVLGDRIKRVLWPFNGIVYERLINSSLFADCSPVREYINNQPFYTPALHNGKPVKMTLSLCLSAIEDYQVGVMRSVDSQDEFGDNGFVGYVGQFLPDSDRLSAEEAEQVWLALEKVKSRLADLDEVDAVFTERFTSSSVTVNDDFGDALPPGITSPVEVSAEGAMVPPGQVWDIRMKIIRAYLADNGFPDVAERLHDLHTITEVRAVLNSALKHNSALAELKRKEREMKTLRAHMTDVDDMHEHNRSLSRVRGEAKETMNVLRGVAGFFDLPRLYCDYVRRRIGNLQKQLVVTGDGRGFGVHLDARYDKAKDSNPGAVSGDCTDGVPLPFGTDVPAHNVKVYEGGLHKGNIYMLQTTDQEGRVAWHMDAIQYPSSKLDWVEFCRVLIESLANEARSRSVDMITINRKPWHISNYDYIARAMFDYLGIPHGQISYDAFAVPESGDFDTSHLQTVRLAFPKKRNGCSQFQGEDDEQIVVWVA